NVNFQSTSNTAKYSLFLHDALPISTTATARPPRPTTPKPHHAALVAERKETTMTTPTPQELCPHWEHEHVYTSEEGPRCANCGKDRKSTRLNSSHVSISYAVFCLKK